MWLLTTASLLLFIAPGAYAADCKVAVVGQPYSTCYDIANAAKITVDQLQSFNKGLDCAKLAVGQRLCISTGTLPNISPVPKPDGSCATHTVKQDQSCSIIAEQYHITTAQIETFNKNTYKWKGCASLQVGAVICVSSGKAPPISVNPKLECGPESPGNKTCPLNVCCSPFGFCGYTDEFCKAASNGDPCISNCGQPTLAKCGGSQMKRKIGYYAGWAARRDCQAFLPENLDLTGYTGVIFAFATINKDNEISLDPKYEPTLHDLVALKERYSGLEVTIAVGGFAFSMDDPTKTVFSQMISTSANRAKFINSLKSFLVKYGVDGIDIDMEYPGAMERQAPATDTAGLTALFKEMRAALGSRTISVATPAGYWFMKGFEIDKIASYTTYINMMSYDYHGPWDLHVDGEDHKAKAHTSKNDILDSIKLYTRAKVDFNKINLGLAWYGRTYAVGSCKGTNCTLTAGGKAGPCSGESGVKSQLEIWNEIKESKITPTRDTNTQTYWYNKGSDFITYDDTATWDYKTQMARDYCFGGTFVWSLDQATPAEPPPPPKPDFEVGCHHSMTQDMLANCKKMVNDIFDTNQYDLALNETKCVAPLTAQRPFCYNDCCLYIGTDDFPEVTIRAKEVKEAALAILDQCHGAGLDRRGLRPRILPLLALIPWIETAWAAVGTRVIGLVITIIDHLFSFLSELIMNGDDGPRGEYVIASVQDTREKYPEFNVIMAHTDHEYQFEAPCYHRHVEWDRPFPFVGTIGYEIYLARRGHFLLKGDGGYINWAWAGVISEDPENSKDLTVEPPGGGYGHAAPVYAKYEEDGELKTAEIAVGLGDPTGCATTFNINVGDRGPDVRCIDVD